MSQATKVPFYANRTDDSSCMLAAIRSALEYFTGEAYSWDRMEEITGYTPHKSAWTVKVWAYLATHGFDMRMVEGFDYRRYRAESITYLETFLKPEELKWQLEHTNLLEIKPLLPTFLKTVHQEVRSPQLTDIDDMLRDGYLVTVQLNSRALNDKEGYVAHMILVYDKDGDEYIAHDPGLPPQESRHIPSDLLFKAMGGEHNTVEITGIKVRTA
jgi:hypothetical protein